MITIPFDVLGERIDFHLNDSLTGTWGWGGGTTPLDCGNILGWMRRAIMEWEEGNLRPLPEKYTSWEEIPKKEKINLIKNNIQKRLDLFVPILS